MTNAAQQGTIWDPARWGITLGSVALIFLAAIEALAVTTVMPVVSAELEGERLYALAFSGTLATSVIGMVAAGGWSDRSGPRGPLFAAVALFLLGLVVSGIAVDMDVFIAGRLIQGLGVGGQTVSLYVLIARVYPRELHGRIFAAFAAAWVVPSMVGPALAGAAAQFLHWRWAFLGVAALTALSFLLLAAQLRGVSMNRSGETARDPSRDIPSLRAIGGRLLLSIVVAGACVGAGFAAEVPPAAGWAIAGGCLLLIGVAIAPLLPTGTLRARPGLPSVILMRGLVAGAFLSAEAFVPKLLMDRFAFTPVVAGLALTAAALAWSSASFVQGRYGDRIGSTAIVAISVALMAAGILALLLVAVSGRDPWLVVVGWGVAGGGMGLVYPRLTVLTLAFSTPSEEGFNSSALSVSDATGSAFAVAASGLAFLAFPLAGSGFPAVFVAAAAVLALALIPGLRIGDAEPLRAAR
ncbi:MFS transporter [Leucobacter allii]|uniref:MFS transporter n=1 Tax=Leucobacter allii TaxID=2932247 RepID=A0ABY4FK60_9MICO|nr:MFS transporter [Leucobacter allii]UOQ56761.1 MFS transporter [Leucobacter allii]